MKIAYLTVVHDNPGVLKRLIAALFCKDCAFFIHIDRKADIQQFSGINGDNIFLSEERIPVYHSGFTQVEATLLLLRGALGRSQDYDYFVLLSGTHYPLRSKEYIHRFLEKNRGSEFISMARMPNDAYGMPLSKLNRIYFEEDEPVRRFLSRVLAKVGLAQRDHRKYLGARMGAPWERVVSGRTRLRGVHRSCLFDGHRSSFLPLLTFLAFEVSC